MAAFSGVVSDSEVETLNFSLDDLSVEGTFRFEKKDLCEGTASDAYVQTCTALMGRLKLLDAAVLDCPASGPAFLAGVYDALACREPTFDKDSNPALKFHLLRLLCTHLQAERLLCHSNAGLNRRELAAERGAVLFQLDKICKDLALKPEAGMDEHGVLAACTAKVAALMEDVGAEVVRSPPTILGGVVVSEEHEALLATVGDAITEDFALRRRMLMKRLDVTIQSFLWGEKAQGKEGEIVAAIKAQRMNLKEAAMAYGTQDALAAPMTIIHEHSKRVTDSVGTSLVKTVIIGAVPDRGGRANEMRPKARDMGFGGRGRGRGSGGGGGRGSGGGGGRGGGNRGKGKGKGGRGGDNNRKGSHEGGDSSDKKE
jgi:hypothetical protein